MFAPTSEARRSRPAWFISAAVHLAGVFLLLQFGGTMLAPPAHRRVPTLLFVPPPAPLEAVKPAAPLPKPAVRAFKLPPSQPRDLVRRPALIETPVIQPAPDVRPGRPLPAVQTAPPPPAIQTGMLDAPASVAQPPARPATVQLGGFSPSLQNEAKAARLTALPAGFDNAQSTRQPNEPRAIASVGGFGGATAAASGGSRANVVTAAGFGASTGRTSAPAKPRHDTVHAGFEETLLARAAPANTRTAAPPPSDSTPVEITFKPRPAYTEEARRLQIEGEVLIEAVFTASADVQILRIIRGLGHGLDESAIAAARGIRFRPARQQGRPVDSTAAIRMSFELAY